MKVDRVKSKREKSSLYPSYTLEDCMEFVELIDSLGGKAVEENSLLGALKLKNRDTKTYIRKLSSSKQFRLVVTKGSSLEVSDLGKHILYPTEGEKEKRKLLLEAFLSPNLYIKLVDRFNSKQVPSHDLLANLLMNQYSISKAAKDSSAKVFLSSAKYVGVLSDDNILRTGERAESIREESREAQEDEQVLSGSASGMQSVKVTLSGGTTGTILIPNTVTKKDVERLKQMLDLMIIEEE